jgi:hypothetical protein
MQQGRFAIERELGAAAFSLDGLKAALATLAEKNPYSAPRAHGDAFVQSTHRRAPHAQSVVAAFPSMSCDPEQSRVTLRLQFQSLREFIERYGIRYVVMSGGVTRRHFSQCAEDADLLLRIQLDELYAPLAAIPGIVFIQSAPNPSETERELVVGDPEFLIDCTPLPGRIRVSFAAIARRDVPPEGIGYGQFREALSAPMRNTAACVDAFVAFFDQSEEFLATSSVPPTMVAMAIAMENAVPLQPDVTGEQRARILIGEDPPRLFNPSGNNQFESF